MAATAFMGLNVAQPFVQFQTSMLRMFAENVEQAARYYEKSFEAVSRAGSGNLNRAISGVSA